MVSKANDDFPDPLTPVMMMSFPPGSETSIFLRLCVRAPRTTRSVAVAASVGTVSDMPLLMRKLEVTQTTYRNRATYSRQPQDLCERQQSHAGDGMCNPDPEGFGGGTRTRSVTCAYWRLQARPGTLIARAFL